MDGGTTRWERRSRDGGLDGRLPIRDAALVLGISEGAVRKRVYRGTLDHVRDTDGRIYVLLPDGLDEGLDQGYPVSSTHASNPLISEMRGRIGFLENELQRKDAILMNMTETMKAITAPTSPEPREPPVSHADEPAKGAHPEERRSWWRRFFGFS
jgi:hypothetical protein